MNRFPPDVDELMWFLAEQGDPASIQSFERRYPEFHQELVRRIDMVRGLKGLVGPKKPVDTVPVFEPKTGIREPFRMPRPAIMAAAAFGVLTLGYASYVATKNLVDRPEKTSPAMVRNEPERRGPYGAPSIKADPPIDDSLRTPKPYRPNDASQEQRPVALAPLDRPVDLVASRTTLIDALNQLAMAAGIGIEIAPQTPNLEISVTYRGASARTILRDMGATIGFTALEQTDHSVLIIPATDPRAPEIEVAPNRGGTVISDEPPAAN